MIDRIDRIKWEPPEPEPEPISIIQGFEFKYDKARGVLVLRPLHEYIVVNGNRFVGVGVQFVGGDE